MFVCLCVCLSVCLFVCFKCVCLFVCMKHGNEGFLAQFYLRYLDIVRKPYILQKSKLTSKILLSVCVMFCVAEEF